MIDGELVETLEVIAPFGRGVDVESTLLPRQPLDRPGTPPPSL